MSTAPSRVTKTLYGIVFLHAFIWMAVNALLFAINLLTTLLMPPWFLFPLLGWGVGLAIHGAVTFCIAGPRESAALLAELEKSLPPLLGKARPFLDKARAALGEGRDA
eukprot:TRINITY_DN46541_c0_g1_i1.p1 TRINITY_DN46541_c0_g1~~TRINITY_DN46541_c0_g1_i1.p1  ORF type:complete len:127 (-),score=19.98 TRINITY_DN46541_c0_g1_i1:313-636(-)